MFAASSNSHAGPSQPAIYPRHLAAQHSAYTLAALANLAGVQLPGSGKNIKSSIGIYAPVTNDKTPEPAADQEDAFDPSKNLQTFEQFGQLPIEIIQLVLTHLTVNDVVCLSLTCKSMRSLTTPHLRQIPNWSRLNTPHQLHFPTGLDPSRFPHRTCHNRWEPCPSHPLGLDHRPTGTSSGGGGHIGVCDLRGCSAPCACFDCPLWTRLGGWMPANRRWCARCARFTRRPKGARRGDPCRHGLRRQNHEAGWTYRKGLGGFVLNGKLWKKYYTERGLNRFMVAFEGEGRDTRSRYGLRSRIRPTERRQELLRERLGPAGVDVDGLLEQGGFRQKEGWRAYVNEGAGSEEEEEEGEGDDEDEMSE